MGPGPRKRYATLYLESTANHAHTRNAAVREARRQLGDWASVAAFGATTKQRSTVPEGGQTQKIDSQPVQGGLPGLRED